MKTSRIACLCAVMIAAAAWLPAADTHVYNAPIERVWDEAVKATRDAGLELTDSDRSEYWFMMASPKKTFSRSVLFEVRLSQTEEQTQVMVRAVDEDGSKKSIKIIAAYLAALDERLN